MSVYPPPTANPIFNKSNFPNNELLFVLDGLTASAKAYIDQKIADLSGTLDLSFILHNGNSAGIYDIDMSFNDISNVNNIDVVTINGSAYPPTIPSDTLQDVLTAGNTATELSAILTGSGTFGTLNNTITKSKVEIRDSNIAGDYQFSLLERDNLEFAFNSPIASYSTTYFANNIQHTDFSPTPINYTISTNRNLVLTSNNIDLSITGALIVPSLANDAFLRYNHSTANQQLYSRKSNSGGGFPMLSLFQDNTATGSANLRFQKNTTAVNAPLGEIAFYGRDATAGNPYREFARIKTAIRNNTAPSNIDGSIDFLTLVNGSLTELMRLNGQNSEIEFYQPLDLNNNAIKTATGDINLNATASSGTGDILLTPKGNVRVSEDILTDSKITTLSGFPLNEGSSIDFADGTPDYRFTIDGDKIELHYNNLNTQATQQIFQDNTAEQVYFKQTFIDSISNTTETLIKNDVSGHSIKLTASGSNATLTTSDLTFNKGGNNASITGDAFIELTDNGNGSMIQLTPDAGLSINTLPTSDKYLGLNIYDGLFLNETDLNATLTTSSLTMTNVSGSSILTANNLTIPSISNDGNIDITSGDNISMVINNGICRMDSQTSRMELILGENVDGSALILVADPSGGIVESNNNLNIIGSEIVVKTPNGTGGKISIESDSGIEMNANGDIDITCINGTGAGAVNITAGGSNDGTNVITLNAPYGNIDLTSGDNIRLNALYNNIDLSGATNINLNTENLNFNGAGLQSNSAGGNSGEHLIITLNGVQYKIKLELP